MHAHVCAFPSHSPDVIISAEDHATLRVAGRTNFTQLGLAAGAFQTPAMPIAIHGIEQEAIGNLPPTACTSFPREGATGDRGRLRAAAWVHHGLNKKNRRRVNILYRTLFLLFLQEACAEKGGGEKSGRASTCLLFKLFVLS